MKKDIFCYMVLVIGLAGCSSAQLNTNRFPSSVQKQPERLFVILTVPEGWAKESQNFTSSFSEKLQTCGTQTHVFFSSPRPANLSLNEEKDTSREKIISEEAAFSPDAVMSINWVSAQTNLNGSVRGIQFNLGLVWRAPNTGGMPWQGSASVYAGGAFSSGPGYTLASSLFDDLKAKGLLPKCSATAN